MGEEEGGGYLVPVFYFNHGRDVTQYMYVIQMNRSRILSETDTEVNVITFLTTFFCEYADA